MPTCKGHKNDGNPCGSPIVLANGYCRAHQDQAKAEPPDVSGPWTRERLEAAIEAQGGPEGLDLAGADLSGLDLSEMDLHGVVLSRWDEGGCISANLRGAMLAGANLQGANLSRADFEGAHLEGAKLQGAVLEHTWLRETHLALADLQRVWAGSVDLQGADLVNANLQGAALVNANLRRADLPGANLRGANLVSANLCGATLVNAILKEAWLGNADLRSSDLLGADLRGAGLCGADLRDSFLRGANFRKADLRAANLRDVDWLDVTDMREVRLYRAKLDRTILRRDQVGSAVWEEQAGEYRKARDTYLVLKQNFESLGDYDAASWAYIKERQMEKACSTPWRARRYYGTEQLGDIVLHRTSQGEPICKYTLPRYHPRVWWFYLRHTVKWLGDWLVGLICGYGERPWRTVAAMAVVFALFVAIYWATWCVGRVEVAPDGSTALVPTRDLLDAIIFSLGAFTTMDATGLAPRAPVVQVLMGIEALLGIGLTGLLGFVVGNRIRRS